MIELLTEMLQFNPHFRVTAKDALSHKVFDKIRMPHFEKPCPIILEQKIFSEDAYDYEEFKSTKYNHIDFKKMLISEMIKVNNLGYLKPK